MKKVVYIFPLVLLALLFRTVWHLGPNIEFVTTVSILSAYILKNTKLAILVPISIMLLSDITLGITSIAIFTWSGFMFTTLSSYITRKSTRYMRIVGSGLFSVLLFYLWTNFGVVLVSNMYTKDISGLALSYLNALPFLFNQLATNILSLHLVYVLVRIVEEKSIVLNTYIKIKDGIRQNVFKK